MCIRDSVNVDRDYAYINFATLSKFFDPTLAVAEQILLCPAFPEEELRTYAAKRRQRLAVERAKIDVKAREAFARALFGERHPYGVSSHEEAYDSLTRDDVAEALAAGRTLDALLTGAGVTRVDIVGIALSHCVRDPALDAVARGYDVRVYTDLSVPVSEELGKAAVERMRQAGITIIEGDEYVD